MVDVVGLVHATRRLEVGPWLVLVRLGVVGLGSCHEQNLGQELNEYHAHPVGHVVSARRAVVPVDDNHGGQDGRDVHDEREYEILGDERNDHGRGRQNLGHEQQEEDQGEQDRDTQCHLFALVRGQVEDECAQEADEHRGYDQIHLGKEKQRKFKAFPRYGFVVIFQVLGLFEY